MRDPWDLSQTVVPYVHVVSCPEPKRSDNYWSELISTSGFYMSLPLEPWRGIPLRSYLNPQEVVPSPGRCIPSDFTCYTQVIVNNPLVKCEDLISKGHMADQQKLRDVAVILVTREGRT